MAVTANQLRKLAEQADGMRNIPLAFVVHADGTPDVVPATTTGDTTAFPMETDDISTPSVRPDAVYIHVPNDSSLIALPSGDPKNETGKYDAVFWSESAVTKFVLPYYSTMTTPTEYAALAKNLINDNVIAVAHNPKSDVTPLPPPLAGSRVPDSPVRGLDVLFVNKDEVQLASYLAFVLLLGLELELEISGLLPRTVQTADSREQTRSAT